MKTGIFTLAVALTALCASAQAPSPVPSSHATPAAPGAPAFGPKATETNSNSDRANTTTAQPAPAQSESSTGGERFHPIMLESTGQPIQAPPEQNQVVLDEFSLTPGTTLLEAIQGLARAAGIRYLVDPRVVNGTNVPVIATEIHWTNVLAVSAINALLDNYDWQMVDDPQTHIARITLKGAKTSESLVSKVIQLQYGCPTNIQPQLTNIFSKPTRIIADMRTSQLVVVGTLQDITNIEAVVQRLDKPLKQILIEARLLETTKNPKTIKGIDWTDTLEGQNVTFGNGSVSGVGTETTTTSKAADVTTTTGKTYSGGMTTTTTGERLVTNIIGGSGLSLNTSQGFHPQTAFLNADGLKAVLSFLNTDNETETHSLPRTVAQDGVETELAVIRNIPIFEQNQSAGVGGQNNLATMKPNYDLTVGANVINEVGVKLTVTPRIVGATNVFLTLHPEVSAQESVYAKMVLNGVENESPIFTRRQISTKTTVPSGYTLVLGGLNNDNSTKNYTKVPILGDIPVLGYLFRHENKERTRQNLLIFVTPTIIGQNDFQPTKTRFLKTKFKENTDAEESAWDNGKPYDWTKPKQKVEPAYYGDDQQ